VIYAQGEYGTVRRSDVIGQGIINERIKKAREDDEVNDSASGIISRR